MKKVVIGLSGGVDSSVAAYLLKEQGYHVIGLFMKNWDDKDGSTGECSSAEDYRDVVSVCGKLDISFYTVNFVEQYYKDVFTYFLSSLKKGHTPNPDVLCNRMIKFGAFHDFAIDKLGADFIATGHYAGICGDSLMRAKDKDKDQTYFLNQVKTEKLKNTIFPLAEIEKSKVRQIAQKIGLNNSSKKDSTGICFIGECNFRQFIKGFIPEKKGEIKDLNGKIVGQHSGVHGFTIGQRRGLGIGGKKGSTGSWFVVSKDIHKNELIVSQGDENFLYSHGCTVKNLNVIGQNNWEKGESYSLTAKFRYRQPDVSVSINFVDDNTLNVRFAHSQRAVTIGQYAVFYDRNRCIGGGEIDRVFTD
ncbi:MAG: tRNA 2-thiouridine(34) synthase MnmA [Clostridiales bacterium]|nr:tRNA 2-thiouridine(34) synthase MnmA [Clostridiales bacterium]